MSNQALTDEVLSDLLDSESWCEILELYARTTRVAVALVDPEGRLVGKCHNPQPIWTLARDARPEWGAGCPFCLDLNGGCTAAADSLRTGSVVLVHDPAGFAHVASPLSLGDRHLGTLIAGQVFDRYPEQVRLGRAARGFGLSAQDLWRLSRQQAPIRSTNLMVYGNLLCTLGQAFLRERFSAILERRLIETNINLHASYENLETLNSELKSKVAELDRSNEEKVVLLKEVHHRVNNNLQVIASLLRLQGEAFPAGQVADALRVSQLRVESMALIHAQLYDSGDLREVDVAEYVALLARNLFFSYGVEPSRIPWRVEIDPLKLSVDEAIPAGLILSELISNALKHAFPDGRTGSILIEGGRRDRRIELAVHDDGIGIVEGAELRRPKSLGLQIVNILCRQLKGALEKTHGAGQPGRGAIFRISFPEKA